MSKVKIPYYIVKRSGRAYWRPTKRMRKEGFHLISCGFDGPSAWAAADEWNKKWQAYRRGRTEPPPLPGKPSKDQAESARRYPPGSIGATFQRYIRTDEWSSRALSARNKVWWPAWFRIRTTWGDCTPDSITFEMISQWRAELERQHGRGVAHKTLRIWRALWTVMLGMKAARGADPSKGIRNRAPAPRHQRWTEEEALQLAETAWQAGYRGLACVIAVAWDTSFSPVDVRTLMGRHRTQSGGLVFDRQEEGRIKTGRPALGTVSRATEKLVNLYLGEAEMPPDAALFRNRSGAPYREDTLSDDFAAVREMAFPGDRRRLMDMRRSGTVEAIAGGIDAVGLSAKLANSIDRSNQLHKTYAPVEIEAVRNVDRARIRGRRKMKAAKKGGGKVSPTAKATPKRGVTDNA